MGRLAEKIVQFTGERAGQVDNRALPVAKIRAANNPANDT
jgi:hypothetical protein